MKIHQVIIEIQPGECVDPDVLKGLLSGHQSVAPQQAEPAPQDLFLPPPPSPWGVTGERRDYQQEISVGAVVAPTGASQGPVEFTYSPTMPVPPRRRDWGLASSVRLAWALLSALLRVGGRLPYWGWGMIVLGLLAGVGIALANNSQLVVEVEGHSPDIAEGAITPQQVYGPDWDESEAAPAANEPVEPTVPTDPPPPQIAPAGAQYMPALGGLDD